MMVNDRYARLNFVFLAALCASCATTSSTLNNANASVAPADTSSVVERSSSDGSVRAQLSSALAVDGSLLWASVEIPGAEGNEKVVGTFGKTEVPFFRLEGKGSFGAVFGVPYAHAPGNHVFQVRVNRGGQEQTLDLPLSVTEGQYRSETLKVDPRHIQPKKKDLIRIKRDIAEVTEIYRKVTEQKYWKGSFRLPIDSPITSPFGNKRLFNGQFASFHGGLDLRAPVGTKVFAPAAGVVVLAKDLFFTGQTVMLDHGYGVVTLYAHLSKIKVKVGQHVDPGMLLGLSGKTGRISGPHLHWQAIIHKTKVNPLDLTKVMQ